MAVMPTDGVSPSLSPLPAWGHCPHHAGMDAHPGTAHFCAGGCCLCPVPKPSAHPMLQHPSHVLID